MFHCAAAAPGAAAQDSFALDIFPLKVRLFIAADQEVPGALGQLGEVDGIVFFTLGIDIDG